MHQVTERVHKQEILRAWLASHLPVILDEKISGISEHDGVLTVFAESAAWCARLRYALAELENLLQCEHPRVRSVQARVLPRS